MAVGLGVSAIASLRIKHKLQQVLIATDDARHLETIIKLDDAYCGSRKHFSVRGLRVAGKEPFIVSALTILRGHPLIIRLTRIASFSSNEMKT